ncbi:MULTISPECIES: NAD-dependent epimerase/dehydratase family protein [unclassified Bosea (in: a-proteobacteria)]|uniref:NAD-dependent epimerase/dehydratase family protein n=1 Tax=unclassified Bosea (in: a-proteobacteria) TaxID=2653178 RepID=UPI000F7617B3|nr:MULTISPECIES: NAD-dependent epimerase/dehydratase family protein [unclassified Bosea (in: a-proteobacteria)]AZO79796.1 NAD-dependent dehydratase [Bosea sp. Tri-49]RXT15949.1 NAD-dependent dehydratase [Bosea sp. Tri-39]RXT39640.1 NAD-dependent dehydratase [Bosea sp. Tri-54]
MSGERILLTGATGFVGRHLLHDLAARGYRLRTAGRYAAIGASGMEHVTIGDLGAPIDWRPLLGGVDLVVHSAGLAHADGTIPEERYRAVNTDATLALAQAAQTAGVRRFVFLSSIRAQSGPISNQPLSEVDPLAPTDAYGRSKLAAEQGLAGLDIDWVALRPVLVYGPGVKANMAALLRLANLPLPLPLGALSAKRSLLAVENLAEAVAFALSEACPARRSYIAADPEPLSVAEMLAAMRAGLGRGPGLIAVPPPLLALAAQLAGRADAYERLANGLVASPTALLSAGWRPPSETKAALARLAADPAGAG